MNKADLIAFEAEVKRRFEAGEIHGPVHLSNGNEDQLINIFREIRPQDWVFSTWRNHYHALLKGIPPELLMTEIVRGKSMSINSTEHRFMCSAIVGGCLPIATGVAAAIKREGRNERVWCFIGDMCASAGMFHDCQQYAIGFDLPVTFVIEDNHKSTYTPTNETWGKFRTHIANMKIAYYEYESAYPHIGAGKQVTM